MGASTSYGRYAERMNNQTKPDPWTDLANAIVAQAADDFRRLCEKKVKCGATMEEVSFRILDGRIREIEVFFKSDWGYLLSHGLAPTILEKLEAEFADGIKEMLVKREQRIENEKRAEAKRKMEQALSEEYECMFEADELPPEEEYDE